jgi:hypothetical protein
METKLVPRLVLITESWSKQTGLFYLLMLIACLAVSIFRISPGTVFAALILSAGLMAISLNPPRGLLNLFLASTLLIPPVYPSFFNGSIPIFLPSLLLITAISLTLGRMKESLLKWDSLEKAGAFFLATTALSLPFSFWFSGRSQGIQSCLRFLLLLQPFVFFVWMRRMGLFPNRAAKEKTILFILLIGGLAAGYGVYDFYFPVSTPHPFASQYIYLWGKLIRRAQGLLYESSNFGNLCAFLLSLSICFLVSEWRRLSLFLKGTLFLLAGLISSGLFFAYSRGSWANFLTVILVYFWLQREKSFKLLSYALVPILGIMGIIFIISPAVFMNFFDWRLWSMLQFWDDPNFASSGRWNNWVFLAKSFAEHPERLIFGIGYKSVATTALFGKKVVADNAYLSTALETGILGLLTFLTFQVIFLRTLYREMWKEATVNLGHPISKEPTMNGPAELVLVEGRFPAIKASPVQPPRVEGHDLLSCVAPPITTSDSNTPNFSAQFMFAFWIGEMVQMFTGDIFTYWRNLVLFFTVIAMAIPPASDAGPRIERDCFISPNPLVL